MNLGKHTLTGGLNLTTDSFSENPVYSGMDRKFGQWTAGLFGQNDWQIALPFTLQTGLRVDWDNHYGFQIVPRVAGIYRLSDEVGLRASAGLGYKVPTIFSDQSDPDVIYKLNPVGCNVTVEKSMGGEFDFTYRAVAFGKISLILNQAFFYTRVNSPILLTAEATPASLSLANANGHLFSRGAETDIKVAYGDLDAFIGYTFTDAQKRFSESHGELFLTPPHKFVMDVLVDVEGFGEGGIELRYTGRQLIHDGTKSPDFLVLDFLFQKKFSHFTFFVAVENLLNFKEANYTPVVTGGSVNPQFNDVWAPLEGRVVNVGLKFQM